MRFYYQFSFVLCPQIHQHRVLEASWGCLEGVLGVSWSVSGESWNVLGASWGVLERLGAVLERPGAVLESSWSRLKRLEAVYGALVGSEPPTTRQQPSGPSRHLPLD